MTSLWLRLAVVAATLSFLLFIASCGGGGIQTPPPPNPTVTSVSVTCFASSIGTGQTNQCSATVRGTGNFNTAVSWSASVGPVSGTGLFTAPGTSGPATITATSVADSSKTSSATVTVVPPIVVSVSHFTQQIVVAGGDHGGPILAAPIFNTSQSLAATSSRVGANALPVPVKAAYRTSEFKFPIDAITTPASRRSE